MDWTADVNIAGTLAGRRRADDRGHGQQDDRPDLRLHARRSSRPDGRRAAWSPPVVGPVATNVHVLADPRTREAIAIDTATPSLPWIADELAARDWTLKLIVSTHGHWDHIGDNAAVADAHRRRDRRPPARPRPARASRTRSGRRSRSCRPCRPSSWPRAGVVRFGEIRLRVLHTPGHTEGSVCLLDEDEGVLYSGDTLFAGAWGRVDLPGGDPDAMVASLARLTGLEDHDRRLPGPRPGDDDRARAGLAGARPRRRAGCSPDRPRRQRSSSTAGTRRRASGRSKPRPS